MDMFKSWWNRIFNNDENIRILLTEIFTETLESRDILVKECVNLIMNLHKMKLKDYYHSQEVFIIIFLSLNKLKEKYSRYGFIHHWFVRQHGGYNDMQKILNYLIWQINTINTIPPEYQHLFINKYEQDFIIVDIYLDIDNDTDKRFKETFFKVVKDMKNLTDSIKNRVDQEIHQTIADNPQ